LLSCPNSISQSIEMPLEVSPFPPQIAKKQVVTDCAIVVREQSGQVVTEAAHAREKCKGARCALGEEALQNPLLSIVSYVLPLGWL
jgi:hypothetical protein